MTMEYPINKPWFIHPGLTLYAMDQWGKSWMNPFGVNYPNNWSFYSDMAMAISYNWIEV